MAKESLYTGDHIIIQVNTKEENRHLLSNIKHTDKYLRDVTKVAKMTAMEAPRVFNLPFANEIDSYTDELENAGLKEHPIVKKMRDRIVARENEISGCTGTITWCESHSAIHCWAFENFITIDLYSCKDFPIKDVIEFTKKYWDVESIVYRIIERYTDKNIVGEDLYE